MTVKEWRDSNPEKKGNIRVYAIIEKLVVLSIMESINALLIQQRVAQNKRIIQLNKVAVNQMKSLVENKAAENPAI